MKISLPYGYNNLYVDIPAQNLVAVLEPKNVPDCENPELKVREAVDNPVNSMSFNEFIKSEGSLLVIVNDGTRPTPTAAVLNIVADSLEEAGASFIIATGVHRPPTEAELCMIFGESLDRFRPRIMVHDALKAEMFNYGTTSRGNDILLNKAVNEAGKVLVIGSVEPHYFAGFTGGRKGFMPGVAAFSTIEKNHEFALSPEAQLLTLEGNPVHEDMTEACRLIGKNIFSIMAVLDRRQKLYAVTAGDLEAAFEEAAAKAAEVYVAELEKPCDLVIACVKPPMDIDLYQSHKAIESGKLALKPGGTLLLISECLDGIGEDNFSRLLSSCENPQDVFRKIEEGYKLGYHKAAKIVELSSRATIAAYTSLDPKELEPIYIEPVSNLQKKIDNLLESYCGADALSIAVIPDASVTVPQTL